jgi:hypothetical protein
MSYQVTELPIAPEPGGAVAVILYQHDEPFNEAVCGWGLQWNTRVACWLASGQPYGITIARPGDTSYERLFTAHDDSSFEAAIEAALDYLDGARCRWRIPHMLRPVAAWRVRERQLEQRARERRQQHAEARGAVA